MENIEEMIERHEREKKELQASCKHENISDWMLYMWAPGHFNGEVKACLDCNKQVETRGAMEPFITHHTD